MELIVAITENNVIGLDGDMPWHLPADLQHFKNLTTSHAVLMGRKTFDSIGKALPNRTNLVMTRSDHFHAEHVTVVHSIESAIAHSKNQRLFVIGGSEIYKLVMDVVHTMHITRIHASIDGDTFFPDFSESDWTLKAFKKRLPDQKNVLKLTFEEWVRSTS